MEKWKLRDYLLSLRKKLPLPFRKGSVSIKRISHISQTVLPIRRIEVSNFGIDFIGIPCLIFQQFVPTIISVFNIPTKIVRYEKHDLPKTRSKLLKSRESELRNWETEKLRNWLPRRNHMFRWGRHGSIFIIQSIQWQNNNKLTM